MNRQLSLLLERACFLFYFNNVLDNESVNNNILLSGQAKDVVRLRGGSKSSGQP